MVCSLSRANPPPTAASLAFGNPSSASAHPRLSYRHGHGHSQRECELRLSGPNIHPSEMGRTRKGRKIHKSSTPFLLFRLPARVRFRQKPREPTQLFSRTDFDKAVGESRDGPLAKSSETTPAIDLAALASQEFKIRSGRGLENQSHLGVLKMLRRNKPIGECVRRTC